MYKENDIAYFARVNIASNKKHEYITLKKIIITAINKNNHIVCAGIEDMVTNDDMTPFKEWHLDNRLVIPTYNEAIQKIADNSEMLNSRKIEIIFEQRQE